MVQKHSQAYKNPKRTKTYNQDLKYKPITYNIPVIHFNYELIIE